jgi:hypothetical protein
MWIRKTSRDPLVLAIVVSGATKGEKRQLSTGENAVMSDGMDETELAEIEQRAAEAFAVAPTPWMALLETRAGLGGESFIRLGDDPVLDRELYVTLILGTKRVASPDVGLDAVIDYIARACDAIPELIAEIRRLRSL